MLIPLSPEDQIKSFRAGNIGYGKWEVMHMNLTFLYISTFFTKTLAA